MGELPVVTRGIKLRAALEGCVAAMQMMHEAAKGDGDAEATARLWNASLDLAERTLEEDDKAWGWMAKKNPAPVGRLDGDG